MKFLSVVVMAFVLGCASTKPGMPERVGGLFGAKVEEGPCQYSVAILVFLENANSYNAFNMSKPIKGCRCSYRVAGVEYYPTSVFPNEMCEEYKLKQLKETR